MITNRGLYLEYKEFLKIPIAKKQLEYRMHKRQFKHIYQRDICESQRVPAKIFNIFAVMEMQIKTTMKYHYTPIKIVSKFKHCDELNVGEDAQELIIHTYW